MHPVEPAEVLARIRSVFASDLTGAWSDATNMEARAPKRGTRHRRRCRDLAPDPVKILIFMGRLTECRQRCVLTRDPVLAIPPYLSAAVVFWLPDDAPPATAPKC